MSRNEVEPKRCFAVGGGLDQGITGQVSVFKVQGTFGQEALVAISIDGPAQPSTTKEPDEDGNVIVKYTPNLPGDYDITVKVMDKPLKGSPFKVNVIGDSDPKYKRVQLVECQGKGINIGKTFAQNDFWVDCRKANIAAGLTVNIKNPERASSQIKINDMGDGTYKIQWKPTSPGLYLINVKVDGIHIPGSPFYVRTF